MIKIDMNDLDKFFVKGELIPAICYEVNTKTVLMLAYMNKESLRKTLETGYTWFWSRSRQEYWNKGATSGHLQKVVSIYGDCDNDTLLVNVEQTANEPLLPFLHFFAVPADHATFIDRKGGVRYDQSFIYSDDFAEALTFRTGSYR